MTPKVIDPPDAQPRQPDNGRPLRDQRRLFSKRRIISLLVLIGLFLLLFSGLLKLSLSQINESTASSPSEGRQANTTAESTHSAAPPSTEDQNITPTTTPPIFTPNNTFIPPLQIPGYHYVIYEQTNHLYLISTTGGFSEVIPTQGFVYNEAVRPILTPTGQLLYSGDGLWETDIFGGTPTQIAPLAPNQIITSMALSNDGTMIAWSTEPVDSNGMIDIYAGPLANPTLVYEQPATDCPCFRIFSFMNGQQANRTLLLTDDRGSHEAVQYGLWSLDLTATPPTPRQVLDEDPQQGPLVLAPYENTLLYSSNEGWVPIPTDQSVPEDIGVLSYANSLDLATLSGNPLSLSTSQVVLPEQHNLNNSVDYHWVTTPVFSPDTHMLVYVEFSSEAEDPYDRSSALYTVQISGSGTHLHVGQPRLLATSTALLLELGSWLNYHILTFYGDGKLYALDVQTGAVTTLFQTGMYTRIIGVVGAGTP